MELVPIKTEDEINREIAAKIAAAMPYFQCVLNFGELLDITTHEILLTLSNLNPHLRFETDRNHNLLITMPTKFNTGKANAKLTMEVGIWNKEHELGEVTDSNTGFVMPVTHSIYAPDVAFILHSKLEQLDTTSGIPVVAPDFVIELRSDSDRLKNIVAKNGGIY